MTHDYHDRLPIIQVNIIYYIQYTPHEMGGKNCSFY